MILLVDTVSIGAKLYKKYDGSKLDYGRFVQHVRSVHEVEAMFAYFGKQPTNKNLSFGWLLDKIGFELLYDVPDGQWLDVLRKLLNTKKELIIATTNSASKFCLKGKSFELYTVGDVPDLRRFATDTHDLSEFILR